MKQEVENVGELKEKLSEQNEAYTKLETNTSSLESELTSLKKSLGEKETEVDTLTASVEELKEGLLTQQNILEEHRAKLIQAEDDKILDEDEIRNLKDALGEAESNVEEGDAKMQEILRNMKNLESTYKAQTIEATRQLNEKVIFQKNYLASLSWVGSKAVHPSSKLVICIIVVIMIILLSAKIENC
jgi:chromosome segregation ATPase